MGATGSGTIEQVGIAGTINGCAVLVVGDAVTIARDGAEVARHEVEGLARFVAAARGLRFR